jgi:hypothetical protein
MVTTQSSFGSPDRLPSYNWNTQSQSAMPSSASSTNVKREVMTPPLSDIPAGPDDTVYTGSDDDSSVKTEPKKEEQDDKFLVNRRVIYFSFGKWYGCCWHLMGDGSNFQLGCTGNSSPSNFLQSLKMTLPARVDGRAAISRLIPAQKSLFGPIPSYTLD